MPSIDCALIFRRDTSRLGNKEKMSFDSSMVKAIVIPGSDSLDSESEN